MPTKEKIKHAYGVKLLTSQHKGIRELRKNADEPSIHGTKLWGSSFLIMDYLEQNPLPKNSKVLEIGCGWGPAAIYCAKKQKASVTASDADKAVFPYLELHAKENKVKIETLKQRFEKFTRKDLSQYDVIIGADVCFWDELSDVLYKLIRKALKAGVKKIIIADPERSPFLTLAETCVEKFYAEVEPWSADQPKKSRGSLLIIENA